MKNFNPLTFKKLIFLLFITVIVSLTDSCKRDDTLKSSHELAINSLSSKQIKLIIQQADSIRKSKQISKNKMLMNASLSTCAGTITFNGKIGYNVDLNANYNNIDQTFQYYFYLNLQQAFDMVGASIISAQEGQLFYTSNNDITNQISGMLDYALTQATISSGIYNYYWIIPLSLQTTNSCSIGGGGGDGSGGDPDSSVPSGEPSASDYQFTCPTNFSFVSVTTSNLWQEGVMTGIYCNLAIMNPITSQLENIKTVTLPPVYFGLPLMNVDGAVIYTSMQAQQISADALNQAEVDMRKKYKANPNLTSGQLATFWLQRMDIQIKSITQNRGKVDNHGSLNPAVIPPTRVYAPCN